MSEHEDRPPRPDPSELTDDERERELTLAVPGSERLDSYERLLREKAERRARRAAESDS